MSKFRKKPVVIDAEQFDGTWESIPLFSILGLTSEGINANGKLTIRTLEGVMLADAGDWIIRGVKGEFYPCKPDIFAATYEAVSDDGKAQRPEGSAEGVARSEPKPQKDQDMSEELKPCPFCNAQIAFEANEYGGDHYHPHNDCWLTGTLISGSWVSSPKWNRRALSPPAKDTK